MQQNTVNLHSIYASDAPDTPAQTLQPAPPRAHAGQFDGQGDHRLRYFVQRDGAVLNRVLRIFLRAVAHSLAAHSPGAAKVNKAAVHIGAVAFIHRFGSSLNEHVHFHVCVVDGVFEELALGVDAEADADTQADADDQAGRADT